ncbi:MAG: HAD family hydrolase [Firmicutes bacterium]|nr:HAD family hydrolase [Alicyclobacillaceae bacterium]MCL6498006.1 HAD family hydrolase [Bacillota bacterium]
MALALRQVAEGLWATSRAEIQAEVADVVVFDVDGVLIDVHQSYPHVICKAVQTYLGEVGFTGEVEAVRPEETAYFKAAGGFNSDWALAQGMALVYLVKAEAFNSRHLEALRQAEPNLATIARAASAYGGGLTGLESALVNLLDLGDLEAIKAQWDRARITRLCYEYYAGDLSETVFGVPNETITGPGLMLREKPLVTREVLARAPFRYGIYTGRNLGETQQALSLAGLEGLFAPAALITENAGVRKPNPEGLFRIARALAPQLMIFAGDNLDDWQTAARYEAERTLDDPPCLFCGVLGGSPGELARSLFEDRGVDLMATQVVRLIEWAAGRKRR